MTRTFFEHWLTSRLKFKKEEDEGNLRTFTFYGGELYGRPNVKMEVSTTRKFVHFIFMPDGEERFFGKYVWTSRWKCETVEDMFEDFFSDNNL